MSQNVNWSQNNRPTAVEDTLGAAMDRAHGDTMTATTMIKMRTTDIYRTITDIFMGTCVTHIPINQPCAVCVPR